MQAVPSQTRAYLAASKQGGLSKVLVTATIDSPGHRKQWKQVQVYPGSQEEKEMGPEPKLERLQHKAKAAVCVQGQDLKQGGLCNCSGQE